jgi:hypothetical protein
MVVKQFLPVALIMSTFDRCFAFFEIWLMKVMSHKLGNQKYHVTVMNVIDHDAGVEGVLCDQSHQRVTITGNVQPQKALRRVKKVKKHSDFWTRESRVQQSAGGYSPSKKPSYTESYWAYQL